MPCPRLEGPHRSGGLCGADPPLGLWAGNIEGVEYDAFTGERPLAIPDPGERVSMFYFLTADVENELSFDEAVGFQALVGDPFQVSGTGGFTVSLAPGTGGPPTAFLEPATLWLCAPGPGRDGGDASPLAAWRTLSGGWGHVRRSRIPGLA